MVEKTSGDDCGDPSLYHVDTKEWLEWGLVFSIVKHSRLLGLRLARSWKLINLRSGSILVSLCNNIPAGMAKRKESLIQTLYETSAAHFLID